VYSLNSQTTEYELSLKHAALEFWIPTLPSTHEWVNLSERGQIFRMTSTLTVMSVAAKEELQGKLDKLVVGCNAYIYKHDNEWKLQLYPLARARKAAI